MNEKKKYSLLVRIVIIYIISAFISTILDLLSLKFFWGFLFVLPYLFILFVFFIIIIIGFIFLQNSSYNKYITNRNVNVFCIVIAIILIVPMIVNYSNSNSSTRITGTWLADNSNEFQEIQITIDSEYGGKQGMLIVSNEEVYSFHWRFESSSNILTLFFTAQEYITLRVLINSEVNPNKMVTYYMDKSPSYVNFSSSAPPNPQLFTNVTWIKG